MTDVPYILKTLGKMKLLLNEANTALTDKEFDDLCVLMVDTVIRYYQNRFQKSFDEAYVAVMSGVQAIEVTSRNQEKSYSKDSKN